jgi:hypothetical protein
MKIARTKEWWLERAAREQGQTIGAGGQDPSMPERSPAVATGVEKQRSAFGRFVKPDAEASQVHRRGTRREGDSRR